MKSVTLEENGCSNLRMHQVAVLQKVTMSWILWYLTSFTVVLFIISRIINCFSSCVLVYCCN